MVITFSDEKVRNYLLKHGYVFTYRKGRNLRKQLGNDWANSGRLTKKIMDVVVEPIDQIMDIPAHEQLAPYVGDSGFKDITEWLEAIRGLNHGLPIYGILYKVSSRKKWINNTFNSSA